jgi:hypothetical protein
MRRDEWATIFRNEVAPTFVILIEEPNGLVDFFYAPEVVLASFVETLSVKITKPEGLT